MNLSRLIAMNFVSSAALRAFSNTIGVIVVSIIARVLGPSNFGYYNAVFSYLFIFSVIADLGLNSILTREISKSGAEESSVVSAIFSLRVLSLVATLVIAVIVSWHILPYEDYVKWSITLGSFYVFMSSLVQVVVGIFQKYLKIYLISVADVVTRLSQLFLILALLHWYEAGLIAMIAIVVAVEIIHFSMIMFFAKRIVSFSLTIDWFYWRSIIKEAIPIAMSLVFVLLYFRIDTVMLSLMRPSIETGIYSLAYKILEVIIFIPAMFVGLILPLLSKYAGQERSRFSRVYRLTFRVIGIMAVPVVLFLSIFSKFVIEVVGGSNYIGADKVLAIISVAMLFIFFGNLGGSSIIALGLQKKGAIIYGFGALVNLVTNFIFIPRYGYIAAAWTTVATEIFVTILMFYTIGHFANYWPSLVPLGKLIALALPVWVLAVYVVPQIEFQILLFATFLAATLIFGLVKISEIKNLIVSET